MPAITVNVAVILDCQILLTKRNDFEVWCLPSGGVEEGESLAQAAIRETKEETGLDVELKSFVGVYSRIGALPDTHAVLFTAIPIGGNLQTQPGETIDIRFFSIDEIPSDLSFGHLKRIEDAIVGRGGSVVVTQEMILPRGQKINSKDIVDARKLSRESRLDFYKQAMKQTTIREQTEIGGSPTGKLPPAIFLKVINQLSGEDGRFNPAQLPEVPNAMSTRKLMTKDFRFWKIHTAASDGKTFNDELCYNTISKQFWVLRKGVDPSVQILYGPVELEDRVP